jgi:hypothetical protein
VRIRPECPKGKGVKMDTVIEISDELKAFINAHYLEHWIEPIRNAMVRADKKFAILRFVGAQVSYTGTNANYKSVSGSAEVGTLFNRKSYFGENESFIYLQPGYTAKCIPIDPESDGKFVFVWGRSDNWSSNTERIFFELV